MSTLRVPVLKTHLQIERLPPEGLFLLSEEQHLWLEGAVYLELVPLLDGRRSAEELAEALAPRHDPARVYYALTRLEQGGCLVEAEPGAPHPHAALWHALGVAPAEAAHRLAQAEVEVLRVGEAPLEPVREAFLAEGLRLGEGRGGLRVVVVDDYLRAPLAALNAEALRSGQPWVLVQPVGRVAWLGPHFLPGQSACWECLAQRLRLNRPLQALLRQRRAGEESFVPRRVSAPGTVRAAAHLLASTVARGLATGVPGLTDTLVTLEAAGLKTEHHTVVRRPQCPACGEPGRMAALQEREVHLVSRPKGFQADGGHRRVSPEETVRVYGHHVSPLTGVVQRLEQIHGGPGGPTPVVDSGPNLSRPTRDLALFRRMLRGRSAGKGMSLAQARASALCEGIERASGVFQGDEARRTASFQELRVQALHPRELLGFSERQYREREAWNATCSARAKVPHVLEDSRRVEWSPAWSLTHRARRWVPTAYCYYGHAEEGPVFCVADSNGCAAGGSLEEAVLQGFLELAERDGVALWWYNRVRRPRVALESFDEPYFRELSAHYRAMGRELWVLDLTTDLDIPTFAAVSRDVSGPRERLLVGFGAHLEARLGIARALTEMNQFLPYLDLEASASVDPEFARWFETASLAGQAYLAPAEHLPEVSAAHHPRRWGEDIREDVEACVARAWKLGLETLVVDQTRPDVGLSVVRVIVPGLRHMWQRFGPGRLYDTPVTLGWAERPTPEEALNPLGIFF